MRVTSYPAVWRSRVGGASHSGLQLQRVSTPKNRVLPRRLNRRDARGPACVQYLGIRITCRSSRTGFARRSATPVIDDTYRQFQPQRVEHALGPGRRVYSNAVTVNDFQASISARAATRNATPLPPSQGLRRDRPPRLCDPQGHLSPLTSHAFSAPLSRWSSFCSIAI
jgi:hypothetical protein